MQKSIKLPADLEIWGMIPAFLSPHCDDPLWKQVHDGYSHGGGWNDFDGFEVHQEGGIYALEYPGDPQMPEISRIDIGDEALVMFPHSWIMWVHGDEHKIARID